jgi:trk system potassium uptake protein TrkA
MYHRSLKLIDKFRQGNKQFAVIGLGRFGQAVCETLYKLGYDVLGTDRDRKVISEVLAANILENAIQLDSTEIGALKEAGILEFDTVIIAIGSYIQESIITTLNLKEGGVKHVIAKASSEIHGKLLHRVGADRVVFPEYDDGCELARSLTKPAILERFDLDPDHSIVDVRIPSEFDGKTLAELEIRQRFGVNVLAIKHGDMFNINPHPQEILQEGLEMVVIGSNKDIQRLPI